MLSGKKSIFNWVCFAFIILLFLVISGSAGPKTTFFVNFGYDLFVNYPQAHLYTFLAGLISGIVFYTAIFIHKILGKNKLEKNRRINDRT